MALAAGCAAIAGYNLLKYREDQRLLRLLRRGLSRPRGQLKDTPTVSIVVAAWNEASCIGRHVESVLRLSYPRKEYILCAGGADGTRELAKRSAGSEAKILEQLPGEGKQRALHKAFAEARGDIIYLTDADCLLDDETFERVLAPVINDGEVASTGLSKPLEGQLASPLVRYQWYRDVYWLLRDGPYAIGINGRNAAVRSDFLERVNAFQDPAPTGTDYQLSGLLRSHGARIAATKSMVRTTVPDSFPAYIRMWQRWIRNVIAQGPRSGRTDEARRSFMAGLLGAFLLGGPAWLAASGLLFRLWLLLLCWGWTQRVRQTAAMTEALSRCESWTYGLKLVVFELADAAAAASAVASLFKRSWRTRW